VLTDDEIARYARQIVVPGIGAAGQEKLLASTVLVVGNARGVAQASLYLRASGVRVVNDVGAGDYDVAVVAAADSIEEPLRQVLLETCRPICWYVCDERGFRSGIHPAAVLPERRTQIEAAAMTSPDDAAACELSGLACALLLKLPGSQDPQHLGF
jgi:hypothetical protein